MMKMKKEYESPLLSVRRIEMESGFCSASAEIKNPGPKNAGIEEHSVNSGFSGNFSDVSDGGWDSQPGA